MKYSAPTSSAVGAVPVFAPESFEGGSANNRFVPPLVDSGSTPNQAVAVFQRVTGIQVNGSGTSMMYAPDFRPSEGQPDPAGTGGGAPSDFSTVIGPLTLTATSLMEFDQVFKAEAFFDGGVIEVALVRPSSMRLRSRTTPLRLMSATTSSKEATTANWTELLKAPLFYRHCRAAVPIQAPGEFITFASCSAPLLPAARTTHWGCPSS